MVKTLTREETELLAVQLIPLDPVTRAIARLQAFVPPEGYWLAFSGGKDSQCIYHLAIEAGVPFEAHYNATTADPPELVRFIKNQYPEVSIDRPERNMWQLIADDRMPPTRLARYCCRHLKERGGTGRVAVTGVRWAESHNRKLKRGVVELNREVYRDDNTVTRQMVEQCPIRSRHVVNPIIDWTDNNVWKFIHSRHLRYCSLYDEGFTRLGCVGCPYGHPKQQRRDFRRWPHFERLYLRAFDQMIANAIAKGKPLTWRTAQEVMDWWMGSPLYPLFEQEVETPQLGGHQRPRSRGDRKSGP